MKVCYFLCYYFPQYVRTKTLINGLSQIQGIKIIPIINTSRGWFRYFETLAKLVFVRAIHKPDLYIVGFRGYEIYWPIRFLARNKPLFFDHMMSPYDSLVFEKKQISKTSILGKLLFRYERGLLHSTDGIITDTIQHKSYFTNLFNLDKNKIHPIYVSTDEDLFVSHHPPPDNKNFVVFFYGSFLPLHGVEYILKAAKLLPDFPMQFHLVGGHKTNLKQFYALIEKLGLTNVRHTRWVDYTDLPGVIAQADLCLGGPFGDTGQAKRIITGKTFQFLAMNKPTVVGRIEPLPGFIDKYNCLLVPQADAAALANALQWAYEHQDELDQIAARGRELYTSQFSNEQISQALGKMINEIRPSQVFVSQA
jgi:glycosyltransferase involved in cell wall biosynthesis